MKEWRYIEIQYEDGDRISFSREEFNRMLKAANIMQDLEQIKQIGRTMNTLMER